MSQNDILEFSYIDKNDGKDIICAPTQTMCKMGCKFCHLTGLDLPVRSLTGRELFEGVEYLVEDLNLRLGQKRCLLVSYMGCGEPLLNMGWVVDASAALLSYYNNFRVVRFAISTMLPWEGLLTQFSSMVTQNLLPTKVHLSLHSPNDEIRRELIPNAAPIADSLKALRGYRDTTGNSIEIHYSLIGGVNDRDEDVEGLVELLKHDPINVKFLAYNEKPGLEMHQSSRVGLIRDRLEKEGITTEHYTPPGSDIGSSCGQFLTDYYKGIAK
jgi:23S rRNA (adenine2503-C2)-methyltransferase